MSSVPVLSEGPDWKCGTSVVGRSDQSQRQFSSNHQEAKSLRQLGDLTTGLSVCGRSFRWYL